MRIAILGCGAMGTVMGAFLTHNGCMVDMIDNYQAHVDALNSNGAHIVGMVDMTVPVHAMTPDQMEGIYDLVFLFTKQTTNAQVLPDLLPHLGAEQNKKPLGEAIPGETLNLLLGSRPIGGEEDSGRVKLAVMQLLQPR